jgi:hypothetical protein
MADITLTHTRADGTVITGSVRDDGVWEILKAQPYRWKSSRNVGLYIPQSRDKAAKTWIIDSAVTALREAGHTVTVTIDSTTPGRSTAEIEADRAERAEARVERREDYAAGAQASGDASYAKYRRTADNWPMGQPLVSDQAVRVHRRMHADHDRATAEYDRAGYHAGKAAATAANQSHRESVPATLRRIETLETQRRSWQRALDGKPDSRTTRDPETGAYLPAAGGYLAHVTAELTQLDEQLAYWREYVETSGEKVWGPGDFAKGDFVLTGGTWYQVERVNPKSVSVPHGTNDHQLGGVVTRDRVRHAQGPSKWTRKVTYDSVRGQRPAADMGEAIMAARLTEYLAAKRRYEDLVAEHAKSGWAPGDPWPEYVTKAEARVDELKDAGGYAGPDGPACCQKYGYLHEPSFARDACRWSGRANQETVTSGNIPGGQR